MRKVNFSLKNMDHAQKCFEWLTKIGFKRHLHHCPAKDFIIESQNDLLIRSDVIMGRANPFASKGLIEEAFSIMAYDDVGKTA